MVAISLEKVENTQYGAAHTQPDNPESQDIEIYLEEPFVKSVRN